LPLAQQHAPAVDVAQHVPVEDEYAPVLATGHSQMPVVRVTAMYCVPATAVSATERM